MTGAGCRVEGLEGGALGADAFKSFITRKLILPLDDLLLLDLAITVHVDFFELCPPLAALEHGRGEPLAVQQRHRRRPAHGHRRHLLAAFPELVDRMPAHLPLRVVVV